jgi:hypothetical protein
METQEIRVTPQSLGGLISILADILAEEFMKERINRLEENQSGKQDKRILSH